MKWRPSSLVPGVAQLAHYDRADLRGDSIAGLTVMAYLVPQVMAYTLLAGLPAQVGLWAAVVALIVYAVLGTSRIMSAGPESTTALLTAAILAPMASGDAVRYATLATTLALLCGAIALVAWAIRAGAAADLLSKPVLVGYMAGIAIIMFVSQVQRFTGIDTSGDTLIQQVRSFMADWDPTALTIPSLILGLGVMAAMLLLSPRFPRLPVALGVILLATLIAWWLRSNGVDLATVGSVPSALPGFGWAGITFDDVRLLFLPAVGIFVVAYADNVLTARAFASRGQASIDNNQEMLSLAGTNLGSSLVGGFPVSSSASRTALGEAAGARTQMSSLVTAASVVVVVLLFGGLLSAFPSAALAGLVGYAAVRLVDLKEFARFWHFRKREFLLAVVATLGVLLFDVLYGVIIAIGLSILDLLVRVARPHAAVLGEVPGLAGWHDVGDYPGAATIPGLVVFRYDSPLFFADADDFTRRAMSAVRDAQPPARWLLINVEGVIEVDVTGLDALSEVVHRCHDLGVVVALVRAKSELVEAMQRHGVAEEIGADRIYPTLPTAVAAYHSWEKEQGGKS